MVHAGRVGIIHGENVVILHAVFVAVVVILTVVGNIVGGINVQFTVEHMGGGIRGKNVGNQGFALFAHVNASFQNHIIT